MDKALIDIGGNTWVDVMAIVYIEPNLSGSTVWVSTPVGLKPVAGTDRPLDLAQRLRGVER